MNAFIYPLIFLPLPILGQTQDEFFAPQSKPGGYGELHCNGDRVRTVMDGACLTQFKGTSAYDDLSPESGIDAATGAACSSNAIARAVKRFCLLAEDLQ